MIDPVTKPRTGNKILSAKVANRRSEISDRLLETAAELFVERGVSNVSVEEIIEAVGISRATFYGFFANKTELAAIIGTVKWQQTGDHNISNALAAIAAARHVGVAPKIAVEALCQFQGVKRRMELLGSPGGVAIYDDFAHHPTAVRASIGSLGARFPGRRLIVIFATPSIFS